MVGNFLFIRIKTPLKHWTFPIFAIEFKEKTNYDRVQTIRFAHTDYGLLLKQIRNQSNYFAIPIFFLSLQLLLTKQ